MNKSQTISELCKALTLFHVKVGDIVKDAKNPFFKSSYATLQNIQEAIREPLIECELTISQHPEGEHGLTTILMHSSGEWIESYYVMTPVKNDPQGIGSCITYQKRYALVSILNLSVNDPDDDGNRATYGDNKPEKVDNQKEWLNKGTKHFEIIAEKLLNKQATIEKVKEHFKLSKEVEKLLIEAQTKRIMKQGVAHYVHAIRDLEIGKKTLEQLKDEYIISDEIFTELVKVKKLTAKEIEKKYPTNTKDESMNSNSIYYRGGD